MLLNVNFGTAAFLRELLNFVTSPALRAPCLIVLSDINIHVKRALRSAQDCGNDKDCGGLLYCGDEPAVWVGGSPTEHQAIVVSGGFSLVSDQLTWKRFFWDLLLSFLSLTPQIR